MSGLLMVGFREKHGISCARLEKLKESLAVRSIYMIQVDHTNTFDDCCQGVIDFSKAVFGRYDDMPIDERSLDDETLSLLAGYELEIMYMMRRQGHHYHSLTNCKNLYLKHLKYWTAFLETYDIKGVVFHGIPHEVFDYIIFRLCEKKGIHVAFGESLYAYEEIIGKRWIYVNRLEFDDDWLKSKNKELLAETDAGGMSREMSTRFETYARKLRETATNTNSMVRRSTVWRWVHEDIKLHYGVKGNLIKRASHYLYGFVPTMCLWHYYNRFAINPDFNEKYVYVPLHYSPECTSSPQGGGIYADQVLFIDILSRSLPKGIRIYVKENPAQSAFGREKEFYDRLRKIRNVKIIRIDTNQQELIQKSLAIATLTGTAGYEGQFFGKPFLMFGYHLARYAPGTIPVRNEIECKKALTAIIEDDYRMWNDEDIKKYLLFLYHASFDEVDCSDEEFVRNILRAMGRG